MRKGPFSIHSPDIETVFVCESFQAGRGAEPYSLETIGLIRYFAHHYQIDFVMHSPSEAKSLIKDDTLRRAGWWTPGKRHANDAVIIAVYYAIKKRNLLTSCLVK